jgi:hypothetical protein
MELTSAVVCIQLLRGIFSFASTHRANSNYNHKQPEIKMVIRYYVSVDQTNYAFEIVGCWLFWFWPQRQPHAQRNIKKP